MVQIKKKTVNMREDKVGINAFIAKFVYLWKPLLKKSNWLCQLCRKLIIMKENHVLIVDRLVKRRKSPGSLTRPGTRLAPFINSKQWSFFAKLLYTDSWSPAVQLLGGVHDSLQAVKAVKLFDRNKLLLEFILVILIFLVEVLDDYTHREW